MAKQQEMIKTPLNGNLYSQVLKFGFGALIATVLLTYFIWHMERQSISQTKMTDGILESNAENSKTFKAILEEQKRTTDANLEIAVSQRLVGAGVDKNGAGIDSLKQEFAKAYELMKDSPKARQEMINLLKELVEQKNNNP